MSEARGVQPSAATLNRALARLLVRSVGGSGGKSRMAGSAAASGCGERGESRPSQVERTSGAAAAQGATFKNKREEEGQHYVHTRSNYVTSCPTHPKEKCFLRSDLMSLRIRRPIDISLVDS